MYILHAHTYKDFYNACNQINAKKQTYNKNNNKNKYNLHKKDAVIMRNAIGNCKKVKMRRRVCCHTSQAADAESIAHTRSGRKQVWCKRHSKRKKYAINRFMLDLKITRHAASATSKGAHTRQSAIRICSLAARHYSKQYCYIKADKKNIQSEGGLKYYIQAWGKYMKYRKSGNLQFSK